MKNKDKEQSIREAKEASRRREAERVSRQQALLRESQKAGDRLEELARTGRLHLGAQ